MNQDKKKLGGDTRREFIKKSTLAAAAVATSASLFKTPVYGQSQAPSTGRVIGANDRINVGYIGLGPQGYKAHLLCQKDNAAANNIAQVAVCDLSKTRLAQAKSEVGGDCKDYADYEKLLENKDVDAVCVSTHDVWHAKVSIDALNAGKHVYVEKPITRYLNEAFEVAETVKKTGKILQVGAQYCSDPRWPKVTEMIKAGKIGPLVLGQDSYMRNSPKGEWNSKIEPYATAEDINWQKWQGQVKNKTEFSADSFFRWRKYYPFCAGLLGDLVPHRLHPLMLATGNPEFPSRVVCLGTKAVHTDKLTDNTPDRDTPESAQLIAEFPSGLTLIVISATVNEQGLPPILRGHKGTLYLSGSRVELKPEKPFAEDIDPETLENFPPFASEEIPSHEKNWFDCIRSNKVPNGNIDLALKVQTVISLGEISQRLNVACCFDEKTRKITTGPDGKEIQPLTYGSSDKS
jgi:predicted dehydrogenase